jgi:hypothetical protein
VFFLSPFKLALKIKIILKQNGRNSKNTGKKTKFAVKLLMGYRIVQAYDIDFEGIWFDSYMYTFASELF